MIVSDVHHVSLNVDDLAAAEAFYVDILGLERLPRPDLGVGGAWLAAGDRQIHLIETGVVPDDVGQHFAFAVDDIEATVAALAARGVETSEIAEIGSGRQCFTTDPSGNRVEFNQPGGTTR